MSDDPYDNEQLKIDLMRADLALKNRQNFWEAWKAVAMILLAAAAISATSRLADWVAPPKPQTITVHLDAPLVAPR